MFTDTHCHISKKDYDNIETIIKNAKTNKVIKMINNGTNMETNKEVLEINKKWPNVYAAIGFHPDSTSEFTKENLEFIEKNIDNIVAIGEIGLDYHYEGYNKEKQIKFLEAQLKIAEKYDLPVIIHSRDATEDTIKTLKKFPTVKGLIHCFTGSKEIADIYIKMGYKLGLGGVITFKNAKIKNYLKDLSEDAIVLETDSPYLSPEPVRGTKNEPANIYYIAKFIAETKGISLEELSKITEKNVFSLFDI